MTAKGDLPSFGAVAVRVVKSPRVRPNRTCRPSGRVRTMGLAATPVWATARHPMRRRPARARAQQGRGAKRSEEHTSELQSLMRISYAVFCLKKKTNTHHKDNETLTVRKRKRHQ